MPPSRLLVGGTALACITLYACVELNRFNSWTENQLFIAPSRETPLGTLGKEMKALRQQVDNLQKR
jgi:hypothetical protein